MERKSFTSFFKTQRVRTLFLTGNCEISSLLDRLIGDPSLYKQYLFDQQFAHQGWAGMVATIEDQPQTLLDHKQITLHDLIVFELLLEMDALDSQFGKNWLPLGSRLSEKPTDLFAEVPETELNQVIAIWQEAFEWSYYDQVLTGIHDNTGEKTKPTTKHFQAMFLH